MKTLNGAWSLQITRPDRVRSEIGRWIRLLRQRREWTQAMLSSASGIPIASISRCEREGEAGLDTVLRLLAALGELDGFADWLKEQVLRASLPTDLAAFEPDTPKIRKRVRVRRAGERSP